MPRLRKPSRICGTAAAASSRSTVIRTSSEPARASAATCVTVAATSAVSVLVIDCTTIGAPPPTATPPTFALRVACLGMMEFSMLLMGIKGTEGRRLLKRQARDVSPRIRREVDRFSAVNQCHGVRVAENDVEWRHAIDRLDRARRHEARDDELATA